MIHTCIYIYAYVCELSAYCVCVHAYLPIYQSLQSFIHSFIYIHTGVHGLDWLAASASSRSHLREHVLAGVDYCHDGWATGRASTRRRGARHHYVQRDRYIICSSRMLHKCPPLSLSLYLSIYLSLSLLHFNPCAYLTYNCVQSTY